VNWPDVWILYRREMRSALRERAIVVNSILMPIFLYPLMLWILFNGISFVEGLAEGFTSRVAVAGATAEHAEILGELRGLTSVSVQEGLPITPEEAVARVRDGELDAFVEFLPPEVGTAGGSGNLRVSIHYDRSVERSRRALERVDGVVARYRAAWLERQTAALGLTPADLEVYHIERASVSTERQMGALLLSELIPLFLVVMIAFGCFYPAIDATAGERERSTWETLMTVSASRLSIVTSKYLYVATLGISAGILNVLAMFFSIGAVLQPFLGQELGTSVRFGFPLMAVPVMIAGAVALGLFFAAVMMILASFARSFKEGQGMITPVFWLVFLPLLLGGSPDRTLTPIGALLPVANVAQMIKDALRGIYLWPLIAQTLLVEVVLVALCLLLARFVLRFEDFLLGAHGGSFWRFLKERVSQRRARLAPLTTTGDA